MRKSIKKSVGIRVAAALIAVLLFSAVMTVSILRIQRALERSEQASSLLDRAQQAEVAHYKWAANLSNALYAGTEFTGSIDPTTCILGQWLYGDPGTEDAQILALRTEMEPLHKSLHSSASQAINYLATNPDFAHTYYQQEIQSTLTTLVGKLDQVVEYSNTMKAEEESRMENSIRTMHFASIIGLSLSLIAQISLIIYILHRVVAPILAIIDRSRPLQDGRLELELDTSIPNELGDLAETLQRSMSRIRNYVEDINRVMAHFSQGDFDVHTSMPFVGDFRSIEESINSFTSSMSQTLAQISQAERRVSGNAEQLSSGAQSLAQGATEQASAVEELYATLDALSKGASQNVASAANAQENADLTAQQVSISSDQMRQMIAAMSDITDASQEIG